MVTVNNDELIIENCPVCGGEGEIWEGEDGYVVECGCPKCRLFSWANYLDADDYYEAVVEKAVENWNKVAGQLVKVD